MQFAQAVHAAGESSPGDLSSGTHAVVLGVPGPGDLFRLSAVLDAAGVGHVLVREVDHPYEGQAMAIGVRPDRKSRLKKHLRGFRLIG